MKVLSLVSTLFAVAYAAPTESAVEAVEEISAETPGSSTVNGVKILPRFSQTS
jgi:hypothetical protein